MQTLLSRLRRGCHKPYVTCDLPKSFCHRADNIRNSRPTSSTVCTYKQCTLPTTARHHEQSYATLQTSAKNAPVTRPQTLVLNHKHFCRCSVSMQTWRTLTHGQGMGGQKLERCTTHDTSALSSPRQSTRSARYAVASSAICSSRPSASARVSAWAAASAMRSHATAKSASTISAARICNQPESRVCSSHAESCASVTLRPAKQLTSQLSRGCPQRDNWLISCHGQQQQTGPSCHARSTAASRPDGWGSRTLQGAGRRNLGLDYSLGQPKPAPCRTLACASARPLSARSACAAPASPSTRSPSASANFASAARRPRASAVASR